jgi:hypothetical protein
MGLASGLLACAKPEARTLTTTEIERDRGTRAELEASIAEDHAALAALIGSDRFEEPSAIYADPELRAIALRLVEQTRQLGRLAETDVLTPGAP